MTENELSVVEFERARHERGLLEFLGGRYESRRLEGRKRVLDWIHDGMPERDREPLRHVVLDGERVVGSMGNMPADFWVGGERTPARFTHDLLVDPTYRGRGLAKLLVKRALSVGGFVPGGLWMTDPCYHVHLKCGFTDMPRIVPYTLVLDVDAFVSRRGGSGPKAFAQKVALRRLRSGALKKAARELEALEGNCKLSELDEFPPELDGRWLELLEGYHIARVRDSAYLNWKYVTHPHMTYRKLVLKRGGEVAGYMIWRPPAPGGESRSVVVDFLVGKDDESALRALVSRVVDESSRAGVEMVSLLSTQPFVMSTMRKMGFLPKRSGGTWVVAGWEDVCDPDRVKDPASWHICMGDSDGDMWTGSQ